MLIIPDGGFKYIGVHYASLPWYMLQNIHKKMEKRKNSQGRIIISYLQQRLWVFLAVWCPPPHRCSPVSPS